REDSVPNQAEFRMRSASTAGNDLGEPQTFPPLGPAIKVLMIWPRFPSSFWSFDGVMNLVPVNTDQPPLGLLTVAALCPKNWMLKLIDRSTIQRQQHAPTR